MAGILLALTAQACERADDEASPPSMHESRSAADGGGSDAAISASDSRDASTDATTPTEDGAVAAPLGSPAADGGDEPDADAAPAVEATRGSLVDHAAWVGLTASKDPFDDREGRETCSYGDGFVPEDFAGESSLYVSTLACDYLSAAQPSLIAIRKGDTVTLRLWQYTLTAPEGATLHLALQLGDTLAWETRVTIPRESGLVKASWVAEHDVPAGTRIVFHLHNHGDNQYNLLELSSGPAVNR